MSHFSKAVILSAGKGSRLKGVTETTPKPMVFVGGKPVLQHNIELCAKFGITDIFINTHHLADQIQRFFGDGKRFGVSITYSYEESLLGTSGALHSFRHELGQNDFLVLYGDNVCSFDLDAMCSAHFEKKGVGTVALYPKEDVSMSGIAVIDERQRITRFIEKPSPAEHISNLVNAAVYVLSPRVFDFIPSGVSDFGRDVFPELIRRRQELFGWLASGSVTAIDTPRLLAEARNSP